MSPILRAVIKHWLGQPMMPPLERPMDAPMCKCGQRGAAHLHRHADWVERKPR